MNRIIFLVVLLYITNALSAPYDGEHGGHGGYGHGGYGHGGYGGRYGYGGYGHYGYGHGGLVYPTFYHRRPYYNRYPYYGGGVGIGVIGIGPGFRR